MSRWSKDTDTDIGRDTGPERAPTTSMATVVLPSPKQIRFVNSEGRPPAKRRRVDSACQTCRKRKIRCDGQRPRCQTCENNRHDCGGYAMSPATNLSVKPEVKRNESDDTIKNEEDKDGNMIHNLSSPIEPDVKPNIEALDATQQTERAVSHDADSRGSQQRNYSEEGEAVIGRRVPYFRWFGPTAMVRGYKQMVVAVGETRLSKGPTSISSASPQSVSQSDDGGYKFSGVRRPSVSTDSRPPHPEPPRYDLNDTGRLPPLIINLIELFFNHLATNFTFLRREKVLRMMEERTMLPILVNAICALSARFAEDPILISGRNPRTPKSGYGHYFAKRAKDLVPETFNIPTVQAAQAYLLLAYEAFGDNKDSGLWMYTGCAIRVVEDLGLDKQDGLKIEHRSQYYDAQNAEEQDLTEEEKAELKKERVDTAWAIYALDRYISSGLGRSGTMKEDKFDLDQFEITYIQPANLPTPLPALMHVIQLYGKASELFNSIISKDDVTEDKIKRLSVVESEMMQYINNLEKPLQFNLERFRDYIRIGQGTNYIMLHLWCHTLIMLVNYPAIWNPEVSFPNSKRELSMSSAKTIADLVDAAQYHGPIIAGNPFTSQPLFFAAKAFYLQERDLTKTSKQSSRDVSPDKSRKPIKGPREFLGGHKDPEAKRRALLEAAQRGYQQCVDALINLKMYWAGTKYILTVLNRLKRGEEPETWTAEEMESTKRPSVTEWKRRVLPLMTLPSPTMRAGATGMSPMPVSPAPSRNEGGPKYVWAMTGTTNSPNIKPTTFSVPPPVETPSPAPSSSSQYPYDPIRSSLPEAAKPPHATAAYNHYSITYGSQVPHHPRPPMQAPMMLNNRHNNETVHDANLLLQLNSPHTEARNMAYDGTSPPNQVMYGSEYAYQQNTYMPQQQQWNSGQSMVSPPSQQYFGARANMETTEIDMRTWGNDANFLMTQMDFLPSDWANFDPEWQQYGQAEEKDGEVDYTEQGQILGPGKK